MAVIGVSGMALGAVILPLSWAAWMLFLYGGSVPAGSLFVILQSAGATGISLSSSGGISGFCVALTAPFP